MRPEKIRPKKIRKLQILIGGKFYFSKSVYTDNGGVEIHHSHNLPRKGYITFVTLGLEAHLMNEIIMHCKDDEYDACLEAIELLTFSILDEHLDNHYGFIIDGDDAIPSIPSMTAFIFLEPIYFESLFEFKYMWALPLFDNELSHIHNKGLDSFIDVLNENEEPDLISINRESVFHSQPL
jgi:hypothetical protein